MNELQTIKNIDVKIGDIVHAYGARFNIIKVYEYEERDPRLIALGLDKIVSGEGQWIDGETITGYFGPTKNFNFQGNANATLRIEVRA
ncbi:hypothetical protein [Burkholderia gladioli]|uniref:hypothetical protein n=1 Tax=Burkholderia gladioli TaxID=28095 RepID=UPI00286EF7AE|nr:hypothetical protein [Burkholderia gladioli]